MNHDFSSNVTSRRIDKSTIHLKYSECPVCLASSVAEGDEIAEEIKRLWIGEGLAIGHRAAVHHFADGEFDDLARLGPRYIGNSNDLRRDVTRAGA